MMKLGYQFLVQPTVEGPKLGEVKVIADTATVHAVDELLLNNPSVRHSFNNAPKIDAISVIQTAVKLRVGRATTTNAEIRRANLSARPNLLSFGLNHPTPFFDKVLIDRTANALTAAKILIKQVQTQVPILSTLNLIAMPKVLKTSFDLIVQRIEHNIITLNTLSDTNLDIEKILQVAAAISANANSVVSKRVSSSAEINADLLVSLAKIEESKTITLVDNKVDTIKNNNSILQTLEETIRSVEKGEQKQFVQIETIIDILLQKNLRLESSVTISSEFLALTGILQFSSAKVESKPATLLNKIKENHIDTLADITKLANKQQNDLARVRSTAIPGKFETSKTTVNSLQEKRINKIKGTSTRWPILFEGNTSEIKVTTPAIQLFTNTDITAQYTWVDPIATSQQADYFGVTPFELPFVTTLTNTASSSTLSNFRSGVFGNGLFQLPGTSGNPIYREGVYPSNAHVQAIVGTNARLSSLVLDDTDGKIYQEDTVLIPTTWWNNRNSNNPWTGAQGVRIWIPYTQESSKFYRRMYTVQTRLDLLSARSQLVPHIYDSIPNDVVRSKSYNITQLGGIEGSITIRHKDPVDDVARFNDVGITVYADSSVPHTATSTKGFILTDAYHEEYERYTERDAFPSSLNTRLNAGNVSYYQTVQYTDKDGTVSTITREDRQIQSSLRDNLAALNNAITSGSGQQDTISLNNSQTGLVSTYPNLVDTATDGRPKSGQPRDIGYSFIKAQLEKVVKNVTKKFPEHIQAKSTSFIGKLEESSLVASQLIRKKPIKGFPLSTQVKTDQFKFVTKQQNDFINLNSVFIQGKFKESLLKANASEVKYVIKGFPLNAEVKSAETKYVTKGIPLTAELSTVLFPGILANSVLGTSTDSIKYVNKNTLSNSQVNVVQIEKDVKAQKISSSKVITDLIIGKLESSELLTQSDEIKSIRKNLASITEIETKIRFKVIKNRFSFAQAEVDLILGQLQNSIASTKINIEKSSSKSLVGTGMKATSEQLKFSISQRVPPSLFRASSLTFIGNFNVSKPTVLAEEVKDIISRRTSLFIAESKKALSTTKSISNKINTFNTVIPARAFLPISILNVEENLATSVNKNIFTTKFNSSVERSIKPFKVELSNAQMLTEILPAFAVLPITKVTASSGLESIIGRLIKVNLETTSNPSYLLSKPIDNFLQSKTDTIKGILPNENKVRFTTSEIKDVIKNSLSKLTLESNPAKYVSIPKISKSEVKSTVIASYAFLLNHSTQLISATVRKTDKSLKSEVEINTSLVDLLPVKLNEDAVILANNGSLYNQGYATDYFIDGYVGEERFF